MWWVKWGSAECGYLITLSSSSSVSWERPPRANFQQSIVIQIEKSVILCIKIHIYTFFLINRYIVIGHSILACHDFCYVLLRQNIVLSIRQLITLGGMGMFRVLGRRRIVFCVCENQIRWIMKFKHMTLNVTHTLYLMQKKTTLMQFVRQP